MKKLLIILFLIVPFLAEAQHYNVHFERLANGKVYAMHGRDTIFIEIPEVNKSSLTITTTDGYFRVFQNGVELKFPSYSPIFETNYYVKTGGSDANDGLTDATAWAHHPWMSTWTGLTTLVAGDVVHMKCGDTWSISNPVAPYMTVGQSGSAGKLITTMSYGTGAKPIIKIATDSDYPVIYADGKSYLAFDGLDVMGYSESHDASHTQDGFYVVDVSATPHDWKITNCDIHHFGYAAVWFRHNCYNITIGDASAQTTATTTAFSNEIYDWSCMGVELDGCDPATDISNFVVNYNYIHDGDMLLQQPAGDVYGVTFTSAEAVDTHDWPSYCYARYNRVENVPTWYGLSAHGGTYLYFQDNFVRNCRMGIVAFGSDRVDYPPVKFSNCWIERNTVVQPGASHVAYTKAIQLSSESTTTKASGYINDNIIYWEVREAEAAAYGIEVYTVDGVTIDGNTITSGPLGTTNGAINVEANGGKSVKNLTITNNFIANWDSGMDIYLLDIDGDVAIHSNIIHSGGDGIWLASEVLDAGTMTIYNNTIMSDHNANSRYPIRFSATSNVTAGATVNIKDNICAYSTASAAGLYIQGPNTLGGTLAIDNNLYWNSSYATPYKVTGSEHTWANWNADHSYDASGLNNTSPTFTNGGGSYLVASDFALTAGSPAINAGANTGVTTDFYGNARVGNYDLGAVEKQ